MTCVIGMVDKNKNIYMGADSAGVRKNEMTVRKDSKIFINGEMIFGFTSSFRMGQILRYKLNIPKQSSDKGDYEYMCTDFIDAARKCLKDNGWLKVENNEETGGEFLVGYKGKVFKVQSDFQVALSADGYDACGCGQDIALGAASAFLQAGAITHLQKFHPSNIIMMALEVAEHFSSGVRKPFRVLHLKIKKKASKKTWDSKW